jgi:hypothetical protein
MKLSYAQIQSLDRKFKNKALKAPIGPPEAEFLFIWVDFFNF